MEEGEAATGMQLSVECEHEIRPTVNEIMREIEGVQFQDRFYNKLGGVYRHRYPVGGDVEFGSGRYPPVVRLGSLRFSTEHFIIRRKVTTIGELIRWGENRDVIDEFGTPYGPADAKNSEAFTSTGQQHGFTPHDWLAERQEEAMVRGAVSTNTAAVLDQTISSKNLTQVGVSAGFAGKTAERQGKKLAIEAARELSSVLDKLAA